MNEIARANGASPPGLRETAGAFLRRHWFILLLLFWVLHVVSRHLLDTRCFYEDVAHLLAQSLALVDTGRFQYEGNYIYRNLTLGPFAPLLAGIPLWLTRDIHAQYYFLSVLQFLAVLVFYVGARRLVPAGNGKFIATLVFAQALSYNYASIYPDNENFLPFFLALFFYFLILCLKRKTYAFLLVWVSLGLCLQLHFTTVLLVPAVIVAIRPWSRPRDLAMTVAGLLLIAVSQYHLVEQVSFCLVQFGADLYSPAAAGGHRFLASYCRAFAIWALAAPLKMGPAGSCFAVLAVVDRRRIAARAPEFLPLLNGALVHLGLCAVFLPVFFSLKYGILMFYFFAFAIFVASLSGYYFLPEPVRAAPQPGRSAMSKALLVFCGVFLLGQVACFATDLNFDRGYFFDPPINQQLVIAARINKLITEQGLPTVGIDDRVYDDDDHGRLQLVSQTDYTYRVLCQYVFPQLRSRFTSAPSYRLEVLVRPKRGAPLPADASSALAAWTKVDEFEVGRRLIEIYLK